ncbi:MAG: hypothetical protein H8E37_05255 [Planctomycetes bacterium]|nr:hypothetical protein [Planctomycetota bacterium]
MPQLDAEEFIEQAYFWRTFRERMLEGVPAQEILVQVQDEVLSTTNLPMALDFLLGEARHKGRLSDAMGMMSHYFTPFQAYIMNRAEEEKVRFDTLIALRILQAEAEYRASKKSTPQGLFIFQFECIARNRLGYEDGLSSVADDPFFAEPWKKWIRWMKQQLGAVEFADFLYLRSEFAVEEKRRATGDPNWTPENEMLFGVREGRIARANRGKDPLYMFQALQRQLGYPEVPRPKQKSEEIVIHPAVEQRLQQMEKRLKLMEQELKGGIDLTEFYKKPEDGFTDDGAAT